MSEFFFVVKTVLFSALVLLLLQMKIGGSTIEQQAEGWIYNSRVGNEMQTVARGAVKAGQEGFGWLREQTREVAGSIESASSENVTESARETKRERSMKNHSRRDELD